ncbi:uncharacterized protein LOC107883463 [Acyrthosiphon pisum]|uniref:Uncharacterized protein n=1 Tax=Acyrthosiphon pisum TaxID=7029 RepID=A0A8R2D3L1_ACYPI|nr:uncharacterized protein LOC107883463 [Acyrthosiphon pisum]|eukprot:XP_016659026.1 PREDICTED: uncharacterized protein LOC107883463 [Acyrthosiphon pisum]
MCFLQKTYAFLVNLFKRNLKNATTNTKCVYYKRMKSRGHGHDIGRVPGLRMGERPVDIQDSREISQTFGMDESAVADKLTTGGLIDPRCPGRSHWKMEIRYKAGDKPT